MSKADALPAPGVADATADQKSENEAAASTSVEQAVETPAPQNAPPPETPLPAAATSETPPEPPRDAPSAAPASKPQAEPEAPPPPAAPEIAPTPAAAGEPPSAPLWLFADILKATKGGLQGGKPEAVHGVSIDSRTLAPGDLFVAIKGERVNGHNYVSQALEKGAVAAVVVKDYFGAAGPLLRVPDPLEALNALARAARARTEAKIIAVTGSAGKTSTKEMLRLALGVQAATHASEKSYNNLWGVPLSLARMPKATKFGVFEIGMNHAGEITPLTRMVRPHVAIVTTVGPVHLEFFSGVDAIAEAKAEIFLGLEADGVAIINRDLPQYEILERRAKEAKARIVTFGEHSSADVRLVSIELFSDRSRATASVLGETLVSDIGAPGKHLALNSLAVLAAVKIAGGDADLASASLAAFHTPDGRGVRARFALNGGDVLLIDESYNANPSSMRAALAVLAAVPRAEHPRRVVALGDMLELGHAAPELHKALAGPIDEASVDVVFACGPHMRSLFDALPAARQGGYAPTAADLAPQLVEAVRPGDAVMVKGSLGSDTGALVGALKRNLSARASGGPASGTQ
ncbi:MAG: UDP-N-acetylmuramoylalanyl-D-glutamyl-2,6-diaminopimelate--D-alanyl-D-alanine ligase [Hyphomicrobiales bacterium]|nr:UDP-N-acetylmuramoylalanyl-D-glutamyl-2,6-diaminopimelate--D-alanyl-D-alanine ligase [Hyphomicrobiales bacterium]